MKFSVLTVCYNSAKTIEHCIESVCSQSYPDIEHIIIDGGSTDGTLEIIDKYRDKISQLISEPDNGIYDAMNKGIRLATGDIIGILNSDDFYADSTTVSGIIGFIVKNNMDAAYGDLVYVTRNDTSKVKRYWKSGEYKPEAFSKGWVPPHPAFFCRKEIYTKYGYFRNDMQIAADFELMLRLVEKHQIKVGYLPKIVVKMRTGGKANVLRGMIRGNCEIIRSFRLNDLRLSPRFFILKPIRKIFQLFTRPSKLNKKNIDL